MNRNVVDKLNGILDFYSIDLDRKEIEKDLTELLDEAYLLGWSDAKDDSEQEGGMCGLVEG